MSRVTYSRAEWIAHFMQPGRFSQWQIDEAGVPTLGEWGDIRLSHRAWKALHRAGVTRVIDAQVFILHDPRTFPEVGPSTVVELKKAFFP